MSKITLAPNVSGSGTFTIAAPDSNTDRTLNLPDNSGTVQTQLDRGFGFRNRLFNGGFSVAQRGTTFASGSNNDDTYNLDRWYVLSDGNDIVDITQNTAAAPTDQKYCIALDVETTAKKFGIAQIIENLNCADLQGQTVTLSFQAKVSSTTKLDNVKCAIVAWSGTADSVTSDIISAWGVEGTNPTLIANATYENTPSNLSVTTSWATYTVSAPIDTSDTNNVIVFIWSDVTDTTAGDFLYVTGVQLEAGSVATAFERRPYGTELALCQRYFQTYPTLAGNNRYPNVSLSGGNMSPRFLFPVVMRASPSGNNVTATFDTWSASASVSRTLAPVTSATGLSFLYSSANNGGSSLSSGYFGYDTTQTLNLSAEL